MTSIVCRHSLSKRVGRRGTANATSLRTSRYPSPNILVLKSAGARYHNHNTGRVLFEMLLLPLLLPSVFLRSFSLDDVAATM